MLESRSTVVLELAALADGPLQSPQGRGETVPKDLASQSSAGSTHRTNVRKRVIQREVEWQMNAQ